MSDGSPKSAARGRSFSISKSRSKSKSSENSDRSRSRGSSAVAGADKDNVKFRRYERKYSSKDRTQRRSRSHDGRKKDSKPRENERKIRDDEKVESKRRNVYRSPPRRNFRRSRSNERPSHAPPRRLGSRSPRRSPSPHYQARRRPSRSPARYRNYRSFPDRRRTPPRKFSKSPPRRRRDFMRSKSRSISQTNGQSRRRLSRNESPPLPPLQPRNNGLLRDSFRDPEPRSRTASFRETSPKDERWRQQTSSRESPAHCSKAEEVPTYRGRGDPRHNAVAEEFPPLNSIHRGKVASVQDFGCFVSIPGYRKQGLVHISQLASYRIDNVREAVSIGDQVWVKVSEIRDNKVALSMRAVDQSTGEDKGEIEGTMLHGTDGSRRPLELGAVFNTVCSKCGAEGHMSVDCFSSEGQKYDLLPNEADQPQGPLSKRERTSDEEGSDSSASSSSEKKSKSKREKKKKKHKHHHSKHRKHSKKKSKKHKHHRSSS